MCIAVLRRYQANVGVTLWGILLLVLSSSCGTGSAHTHEGVRRLHSTQELVDLVSGESHRPMYTLLFFGWPDWDETTREWLHVLSEAQTYPLLRAMKQVAAFEMVVYFLETPQSLAMADLLGILEFPSVSLLHHRLERRAQSSISNQVSNEPVRTLALSHPLQYASTTPVTPSELAIWIVANVPTRVIHPSHLHMERLVQEVEEGPEDRVWAVRQESESDASVGLLVMVVFLSSSSSLLDSVPLRVAQNTVAASLRSRYWVRFQRCARLKRGALSDPEVLITAETGDSNVFIFQKEATGSYRVLHAFRQTDWLDLHSLESKIRLQLENAAEVISWDTIEKRDTFDRRRRIVHYAERPFTEIRTGEMYDRTIRTGSNFVTLALCFETEPDDMAACQAGYANFILCALTARSQLPLRFFWVDTNRHPRFSRAIVSQHRKEHPSDRIFVLSILPVQHQGGGIRHAARLLSARSWDTLDGAKYATNMFSNHRLSLFDHPSPSTFEKSEEDTEAMDENDEEVISASSRVTLTPDFPDEEEESVLKVGQDDLSPPAPRRMGAQGKPGKPSSSGNRAKKTAAAKGSAQSTLRNKQAKLDEMKREIEEKKRRKDQRVKEKQERLDEERHVARNTNRRKLEKQAARKKQKEAEKAQRQRRAAQSNKAKRDEEKTNPQRGDKKSERKRSGKQAEEEL